LDAFPHRISPRYPVARFSSKATAGNATTALQARVAELARAAETQQDRDDLDVLFRTVNPRFFVIREATLSGAELARTKERIERLASPTTGTASMEERFLRAYWLLIRPTLAQFEVGQTPKSKSVPLNRSGGAPGPQDESLACGLELVPGGFTFRGHLQDLTGKPRDMLEALLQSRHRRCTVPELREALQIDDEAVSFPDQVIKDTAKTLRAALKKAAKALMFACDNPLPSTGKGRHLTYTLAVE
jgi:hypothetical protein